jgi:hypothetical protein
LRRAGELPVLHPTLLRQQETVNSLGDALTAMLLVLWLTQKR